MWDLQSAVPQMVISHPNDRLRGLSFSADQQLLAYTVGDSPGYANIEVLSATTGVFQRAYQGDHDDPVKLKGSVASHTRGAGES